MKISIHEIEKTVHNKPFKLDHEVDVSELESMNRDIRKAEPAHVQGECMVEGKEYIFSLNIKGTMILPCARTLNDVPYSYDLHVIEIFTTSQYLTKEEKEEEIHPIDGYIIDLKPYILENILLHKPYRVFSKEKAKDMKFKGEGWELMMEEDFEKQIAKQEEDSNEEQAIDPRMAKLKGLLDDQRDD